MKKSLNVVTDVKVSNNRSQSKTFFCSKAERREAGTTVTMGPCVPIILCTLLTYTDLVVEEKCRKLQGARENRVTVCETVCAAASSKSDVLKYFRSELIHTYGTV